MRQIHKDTPLREISVALKGGIFLDRETMVTDTKRS